MERPGSEQEPPFLFNRDGGQYLATDGRIRTGDVFQFLSDCMATWHEVLDVSCDVALPVYSVKENNLTPMCTCCVLLCCT